MHGRTGENLHPLMAVGLRITLPLIILVGLGWPFSGSAANAPTSLQEAVAAGRVSLGEGQSLVLQVSDASRVAVAEPKIADVAVMGRNEVLVSARAVGETTLHIWDRNGLSSFSIRVLENTGDVLTELKNRIGLPGVDPWMRHETVVLEGWVQSPTEKQRAVQVAGAYGKVVDLLAVRPLVPEMPEVPTGLNEEQRLKSLRELVSDQSITFHLVNGSLLITGYVADTQTQERLRKVAGLYFTEIVDATEVRFAENGQWPVEVYRVIEKEVVQVDK